MLYSAFGLRTAWKSAPHDARRNQVILRRAQNEHLGGDDVKRAYFKQVCLLHITYLISVAGIDLICLTNARFRGLPLPSAMVSKRYAKWQSLTHFYSDFLDFKTQKRRSAKQESLAMVQNTNWKRILKMSTILPVVLSVTRVANSAVYNVQDFGVVGDGITVNTEAIAKVFAACNERSAIETMSTVVFPSPGIYVTSSWEIACNNTIVVIETGATVASVNTTLDW